MKRILCLLLTALLMTGSFALAEEAPAYWEPVLSDPQTRYPNTFGMEWDGSETMLYFLIDDFNDEQLLVEEYGSLMIYITMDPAGGFLTSTVPDESTFTIPMCLTMADGRRLQIVDLDYAASYATENRMYVVENGELARTGSSLADFHSTWESYKFPFISPITALMGLEQDENGHMYMLLEVENGQWLEFVISGLSDILSLRIYSPDENGVQRLVNLVSWETAPAPEIPQCVLDMLAQEPAPQTTEEPQAE